MSKSKKKDTSMKDASSNIPLNLGGISQYLKEVRSEFAKITWPERRQIIVEGIIVIVVVFFFTILTVSLDKIYGVFFSLLENWIKHTV